jgi:hypothetical protein
MTKPFVHAINEEFRSISGYYIFLEEGIIEYAGKRILFLLGEGEADSACCGRGRWRYVLVPGVVVDWKGSQDEKGRPISLIDPIMDPAIKAYVQRHIMESKGIPQVQSWLVT